MIEPPKIGQMIATTRDGRDITRGYTGALLTPQDELQRERGGPYLDIYRRVRDDDRVASCFGQRRLAVIGREWQVQPASDRRADRKAAEFVHAQLLHIGFDRATNGMLWGVFYGYAVGEIVYRRVDGMIGWDQIRVRDRRRFRYDEDLRLRLLTTSNMYPGEELPDGVFWSYQTGADHDDEPYGLGLAHWLYWPTHFKRHGVGFWLRFLDRFASPTAVGEYPQHASADDQGKLLQAVEAIQIDSGIVIPQGMVVRLLEAARSGTGDYKALYDAMNEAIAITTLGQSMTTSDGSSLSQSLTHLHVRQELTRADADLICESLNQGPVRWLTQWNFDGSDPPRVYRVMDEPEDLDQRAEREQRIYQMGYRPTLRHVVETYGGEWEPTSTAQPEDADEPDSPAPSSAGAASFAAQERLDRVDQLLDVTQRELDAPMTALVEQIRAEFAGSVSMDDLRGRMLRLADSAPPSRLVEAMQTAMGVAHLAGELDAQEDADG